MALDTDVIIIGAGFAGSVAAHALDQQGIKVKIVDRAERYPIAFRAEKIEEDQAALMRRFGLLEYRRPLCEPIGKTINYRDGKSSEFDTAEQYGINYTDTVNSLRDHLPERVEFICGRVQNIQNSPTVQRVTLNDRELEGRLLILATGGHERLLRKVGITRMLHRSLSTQNIAFDLLSEKSSGFDFSGFNYFLTDVSDGVDYLTLFQIGETMRANVFLQLNVAPEVIKRFKRDATDSVKRFFPDIERQIGCFSVQGDVRTFATQFYRARNTDQPGVAIIGDDFQSVSPATGTGLSKVLTDVDRLCSHYVPNWLASSDRITRRDVESFYRDGKKRHCDDASLRKWIWYRDKHRSFWGRQMSKIEWTYKSQFKQW